VTEPEQTPPAIVAVSGLAGEARIAAGPGVRAIAAAGDPRRLAHLLEREVSRGARGIMSFGIAGGLAEDIEAGAWLIGRAVVTGDARWLCDPPWAKALVARLPGAIVAELAGVDAPVMRPAAKLELRRATGAAAVDTESHVAAAIAAKHGLPFAAFRVVADSARRSLPPVAAVALTPNGTVKHAAVLRSLARTPSQIPTMLRTAVDARRAYRALSRGRRRLGRGLAHPDLGELLLDVT
jgi:hopanoid-associated phosphorylase